MGQMDLTAASNVLKVFYLPPMREMLNQSTVLLSRIDRDDSTQDVSGTSFTVPIHMGRNEAAGVGRAENGQLPTAGNQQYSKAIIPNKYLYGRIKVSGPVIAATKNNAGAFIRAIESEIKGCMRDTKKSVNRQMHSDGLDALAYLYSSTSSSTIVIDDNMSNPFIHIPATGCMTDLLDASSSYVTLTADAFIYPTTVVAAGTGYTALVYTDATKVTPKDLSASRADGDPFVLPGTKGYQMMGIAGIISASDPPLLAGGLHGLTVADNTWWTAQTVGADATLADLTFPLMQSVFSKIAINSDYSESDIKFLLCNYQVRDKYVELCTNERRMFNTMTLDGGFEAVDYNGKPLIPDPQCKRNRLYFVVPDTLKIFRSSDFDWMDRDGSTFKAVAGYDQYEAILFHYGDLGCVARNGNGVLLGIRE